MEIKTTTCIPSRDFKISNIIKALNLKFNFSRLNFSKTNRNKLQRLWQQQLLCQLRRCQDAKNVTSTFQNIRLALQFSPNINNTYQFSASKLLP